MQTCAAARLHGVVDAAVALDHVDDLAEAALAQHADHFKVVERWHYVLLALELENVPADARRPEGRVRSQAERSVGDRLLVRLKSSLKARCNGLRSRRKRRHERRNLTKHAKESCENATCVRRSEEILEARLVQMLQHARLSARGQGRLVARPCIGDGAREKSGALAAARALACAVLKIWRAR
eukprot:5675878-Pleurochrysis_carterae.AAC.6